MILLLLYIILMVGCTTTQTSEPTYQKITTQDVLEGYGVIGDSQKEVLRERTVTEVETRCCGPRGSILDFWNKKERVIREKDHDYQQEIVKE